MSTTQPTLDDVWQLFKELIINQKETDRKFQETDRNFKELIINQKETQQETDRKFQETDRKFQETDRKFQETNRELDKKLTKMSDAIGRLGNRLGDFIEDAVKPAAVRLFRERGINVHEVMQNVVVQRHQEGLEIDLLVTNDTELVAIECKSTLDMNDVNEHQKRLNKIKKMMPKYANYRIMGAVAAMVIADDVAQYASQHGFFVIGQSGDQLILRNDSNFKPKEW